MPPRRKTTPAPVVTPEQIEAEDLLADGAMKVEKAAEFSGLSVSALYELMADGTLPYVKPDSFRRIPKRALVRHLAATLHR